MFLFISGAFITNYAQNYLPSLVKWSDFNKISGMPLSDRYGRIASVKVVYDITKEKIYFVNSLQFQYHYEFCSYLENKEIDLSKFNDLNYSDNPKRQYLLGNVNYYQSIKKYALEISATDQMSLKDIQILYKQIADQTYFKDQLYLLLNAERLLKDENTFKLKIQLLNPTEVYANLQFQAIGKHQNTGTLKFIDNIEKQKNEIKPDDIIVIKESPIYLPTVSGIIVTEFQTPLSHLSILGQNRKIPICAYKSAYTDKKLKSLEGKLVSLRVLADTFRIETTASNKTSKKNEKAKLPKADLSVKRLIDVNDLKKSSVYFCGSKAANFGVLNKISKSAKFKVSEGGFAIPFYFYQLHVSQHGIDKSIDKLLASIPANKDSLKLALKFLRKQIQAASIDTCVLIAIKDKIIANESYARMRFRSSTNAEDIEGFSGAGLYTSTTGDLNDEKKSIEKAVKKVWASLWSYEAFEERTYYGIDHKKVYMGILVHRSFPDEAVNGVAITKNLYRQDSYGFVVNAQIKNFNVVKPDSNQQCDQFICYPNESNALYRGKGIVDIIAISNMNGGKMVMEINEIQLLADQLEIIKKYYAGLTKPLRGYLKYGLDVEFKLDKDRKLFVKQVRPYND